MAHFRVRHVQRRARKFFFALSATANESTTIRKQSFIDESQQRTQMLQRAHVKTNRAVCREHFVMSLTLPRFRAATPGQFVHLAADGEVNANGANTSPSGQGFAAPFLRRAFSIAGCRHASDAVEIDVLYRTVGVGTNWLASLQPGDAVSVMGPLGNGFAPPDSKSRALLVAGGVGLPPLLWLAQTVTARGGFALGVSGAVSADLVAVPSAQAVSTIDDLRMAIEGTPSPQDSSPPWLIATDDGSRGFHGNAVDALRAVYDRFGSSLAGWTVYTCGPEAMMRAVSEFCGKQSIPSFACMERAMSCGTGTCQSCVVALDDDQDSQGWRYHLCCTDGPVFDSSRLRW